MSGIIGQWLANPALRRGVFYGLAALTVLFMGLRLVNLRADFPVEGHRFVRDGVLYTDEGWYANNAIALMRTGSWYNEGDMNFAIPLPVMQVVHVFFFAVFGVSIEAVRMTSAFSFFAAAGLTFMILRKLMDAWTGLLAVFLMATNFFFFAYSRLGLAENTMLAFLMLAVYLSLFAEGRRGWLFAVLSALAFTLAVLTKTSAVTALPAYLLGLFMVNSCAGRWERFCKPAVAGGIVVALAVIYRVVTRWLFSEDLRYFDAINVGMQIDLSPGNVVATSADLIDRMKHIDKILRYYYLALLPLLLVLYRSFRASPLVWVSLVFVGCYLGTFSIYASVQPRYWAALSAPLAMLFAVGVRQLVWSAREAMVARVLLVLVGILGSVAVANNVAMTAKYMAKPQYSFAEMARAIHEIAAPATQDGRPVLLGHFAHTVALFEDFKPVNDLYGPAPLEHRLRVYRPQYLITEDDMDAEDVHDPVPFEYAGGEGNRPRGEVLREFYEIEEVRRFDVLANYKDYRIHLYRLTPRPEAPWDGDSAVQAVSNE